MATINIRWKVVSKIIDLIQSNPLVAGVTVAPGWPGERNHLAQIIWIDDIDGNVEIPVMTGGRKQRNDTFDIPIQFQVLGLVSLDDTMNRLTELVAIVEDTLADDTSLDNLDGVLSAEITRERMTSAVTTEGPVGFAEVTVSISTRLL